MRKRLAYASIASFAVLAAIAAPASAAPTLRLQVDQRGDFMLIGNTMGYECSGAPTPIVGTVGACGTNTVDSSPDIYWRSDFPVSGQAQADTTILAAMARTTAVLNVPPGATITHAFLYWAAGVGFSTADTNVVLERPGNFSVNVTAVNSLVSSTRYQSMADVTAIVQTNGPGGYRVSGIDAPHFANINDPNQFAGWWMVVFYERASDPFRTLSLFDGLDAVASGMPVSGTLAGFIVPTGGFDAKLGLIAYDGDDVTGGDSLTVNGTTFSDAQNPATNFFNGTRSTLGVATHIPGDLPELTGAPRSMSGIDLDIVDIAPLLAPGQTSASYAVASSSDIVFVGGIVSSIATSRPNFASTTKAAVDLNGGVLVPGDVVEYSITAMNTGNEVATNVVLSDFIPAGLTYVPGSLMITQGANSGTKTDAPNDDQAEYNAGTTSIVLRLGTGANDTTGGTLAINASTTVVFRVSVDANALGPISNQAIVNASGQSGSAPFDTFTDGNGVVPGQQSTVINVVECATNAQCSAPTPYCDADNACVECLGNAQCSGLFPTCDANTSTCICVSTGAELCDNIDNDCNGVIDNGFNVGMACSVGVGACVGNGTIVCNGMGGAACNAVAGTPGMETCDNIDNDCNGVVDNGFNVGMACSVGVGACAANGTVVCNGLGGAGCSAVAGNPGTETCDGIDNDCNGVIDNGFDLGAACSVGVGACAANGTIVCNGMGGAACNAVVGSPMAEICDGIDNDCNGAIDNGFNVGMACSVGVGACAANGTIVCNGMGGAACNAVVGSPMAEICDGIDNDCNVAIDNGFDLGAACSVGVGACAASGTIVCNGMGGAGCSAVAGIPVMETCDGIDNDCDGVIDNGFDLGTACSTGVGECVSSGVIICDGMGAAACNAVAGNPGTETCDGLDNDCDGTVDNGFNVGMACSVGIGECAVEGMVICDAMGGETCDAIAAVPGAEICGDGLDNDCDGSTDEDCMTNECTQDSDCGNATSGQICNLGGATSICVIGCRGTMGNGCPDGKVCTSTTDVPGACVDAPLPPPDVPADSGCGTCAIQPTKTHLNGSFGLLCTSAILAFMRRRRRASSVV